ncbi:bifunctional oligoribonuclease/PAP phosphatase NrnA [Cohnella endophytica]|uniref:Bifunctional oligoribonuclease/PAP phosphatase NrnA n=1 Tax=Cohnella endophytica TaxID=2419778 RepID=A0A494XYC4_9BACL|nr:bifunctional oligoribonuclease/PAP phosphatase NrnA [Cohnella endophytica]RKP55502.1 bifunctional oligoribonuclease/PAP phosphatase NrnA [Cohnella endophytica]
MWANALKEAAAFIRERDDFLIVSHVQPDGDAISSTVATGWLLEKLGKKYTMLNEGPVPSRLRFLWNSSDVLTMEGDDSAPPRQFRNVICVDCADYSRVGRTKSWFAEDAELLNIDHHPTNDGFGRVNLMKFHAAATAEILFELTEELGQSLDVDIATAIYTGLLTDTGGFRYSNTSPFVLSIASRLLEAGVNGPELAELLLERMTPGQLQIIQRGLSRLAYSSDQRISWLWVTSEDLEESGATNEDLEGLVNYPRNVEGVEVGMLFKQNGTASVKVSLRSAGKVNVAAVAQHFGGGGHVRAAGCRLTEPLPEVIRQVVEYVQKALDEQ